MLYDWLEEGSVASSIRKTTQRCPNTREAKRTSAEGELFTAGHPSVHITKSAVRSAISSSCAGSDSS